MAPEIPQEFVKQTVEKKKRQTISEDLKDPDVIERIGAVRQTIRNLANWQSKSAEASEFREDKETLKGMVRDIGRKVMSDHDRVFGKVEELIHEEDGRKTAADVATKFIDSLGTYFDYTDSQDLKEMLPLGISSLLSLCKLFNVNKPEALKILETMQDKGVVEELAISLFASALGKVRENIKGANF